MLKSCMRAMDASAPLVRRVSLEEFSQALQRASFGLGAGLAFRYDARRDETIWTINGQPVGLTVGRIGAIAACYLATPATATDSAGRGQLAEPLAPAAAAPGQFAALHAVGRGRSA